MQKNAALSASYSRPLIGWVLLLLSAAFLEAIFRLGAHAWDTMQAGLSPLEWTCNALMVGTFAYVEGYRALQKRFAPAVAARMFAFASRPLTVGNLLRAPLFALSLIEAPPSSRRRAWLSVILIVLAVILVRQMPFPWRGMVDAGVAVALSWGLCALWWSVLFPPGRTDGETR